MILRKKTVGAIWGTIMLPRRIISLPEMGIIIGFQQPISLPSAGRWRDGSITT